VSAGVRGGRQRQVASDEPMPSKSIALDHPVVPRKDYPLLEQRFPPSGLVWSGEDTLCGVRGDHLPLVENLLSGGGIKMTNEA
jgi:hypothetical protein